MSTKHVRIKPLQTIATITQGGRIHYTDACSHPMQARRLTLPENVLRCSDCGAVYISFGMWRSTN